MGAIAAGNTPATELIFARVIAMIENDDDTAYPNHSVFIPADASDFGIMIRRALLKAKPIVVVYPDGRERLIPAPSISPESA